FQKRNTYRNGRTAARSPEGAATDTRGHGQADTRRASLDLQERVDPGAASGVGRQGPRDASSKQVPPGSGSGQEGLHLWDASRLQGARLRAYEPTDPSRTLWPSGTVFVVRNLARQPRCQRGDRGWGGAGVVGLASQGG